MRNLYILVGIPGSGKSTLIDDLGVENYTVSSDHFRKMNFGVIKNYDHKTLYLREDSANWDMIYSALTNRMELGQTIFFDSTGLYPLGKLYNLAESYLYDIKIIYMDEMSFTQCMANIKYREINNYIPEKTMKKFQTNFENFTSKYPIIKLSELKKEYESKKFYNKTQWRYLLLDKLQLSRDSYLKPLSDDNLSIEYDRIYSISDIHGEYDLLEKFLKAHDNLSNERYLYVFLGDYLDKGAQNLDVLNKIMELSIRKNVILLEGNHDVHLWNYVNCKKTYSKEFIISTKLEIEEHYPNREQRLEFLKSVKRWYRKNVKLYFTMIYYDKLIFFNHSGVSYFDFQTPAALLNGKITDGSHKDNSHYHSYIRIADKFQENYSKYEGMPIYQIFGHRNITPGLLKDKQHKLNEYSWCMDCQLARGNNLDVLYFEKSNQEGKYEHYKR